jgi:hypothetical protein
VRRTLDDEAARWTLSDHLLACAVDALRGGNWQRSGGKGTKPKPLPRPGLTVEHRYGATDRTPEEVAAYLAQFRPPPLPADDTLAQPSPEPQPYPFAESAELNQ